MRKQMILSGSMVSTGFRAKAQGGPDSDYHGLKAVVSSHGMHFSQSGMHFGHNVMHLS